MHKIQYADPPGRFPKGYFDSILTPTRLLLDRGLKLCQAVDWLIDHGVLAPQLRRASVNAMRSRLMRFRTRQAKAGEVLTWKAALGYDAAHATSGVVALCGAKSARWMGSTNEQRRCRMCQHAISVQGLTVAD